MGLVHPLYLFSRVSVLECQAFDAGKMCGYIVNGTTYSVSPLKITNLFTENCESQLTNRHIAVVLFQSFHIGLQGIYFV